MMCWKCKIQWKKNFKWIIQYFPIAEKTFLCVCVCVCRRRKISTMLRIQCVEQTRFQKKNKLITDQRYYCKWNAKAVKKINKFQFRI